VYTTCLFCHADLGRNEALEAFPVGRRLAYDADKGRLWVVCRRCERWNLTPQEERWEAIEQAERLYRATRLRASTGNVGLARVADRTDLVRIGRPPRAEFAAWRYGDQFGRRRRRHALVVAGGAAAVGAVLVGGVVTGAGFGGRTWMIGHAYSWIVDGHPYAVVARVPGEGGPPQVRRKHLLEAALVPSTVGPFALYVRRRRDYVTLDGEQAVRAAALLLPAVNRRGGSPDDVTRAVDAIDAAGGPEGMMARVGRTGAASRRRDPPPTSSPTDRLHERTPLVALATPTRLALEMALHEEQERRAMAGELAALRAAWRDAEEIAAIADGLLLPEGVTAKLAQLRGRSSARTGAASSPTSDSGGATSS
jgi:hypothetical protein